MENLVPDCAGFLFVFKAWQPAHSGLCADLATLLIRATSTFAQLHKAIQQGYGWWDSHLWQFRLPAFNGKPIAGLPTDLCPASSGSSRARSLTPRRRSATARSVERAAGPGEEDPETASMRKTLDDVGQLPRTLTSATEAPIPLSATLGCGVRIEFLIGTRATPTPLPLSGSSFRPATSCRSGRCLPADRPQAHACGRGAVRSCLRWCCEPLTGRW